MQSSYLLKTQNSHLLIFYHLDHWPNLYLCMPQDKNTLINFICIFVVFLRYLSTLLYAIQWDCLRSDININNIWIYTQHTTIGLKTPIEIWTEKPVDYSHLHAFGCLVYMMYNVQERTKLVQNPRDVSSWDKLMEWRGIVCGILVPTRLSLAGMLFL